MIIRLAFDPKPLQAEVQRLRESLLSSMERLDASTIPGFITTYGFLCDFFGVPFNEEVSWVSPFIMSTLSMNPPPSELTSTLVCVFCVVSEDRVSGAWVQGPAAVGLRPSFSQV